MNAAQAEATGTDLTVEWDGVTLTLPANVDDWDPDAVEAFESGKVVTAIRGLLGDRQYEQARRDYAKAHDGRRPTMGDLGRLMDLVAQTYGFGDAGE